MPKTFKKEFIAEGCAAHVIKRPSGKGTYCYEIRYRRNGYNVTASSTDPAEAKQKFIAALKEAIKHPPKAEAANRRTFGAIAEEWLSTHKGKVKASTHQDYARYLERFFTPLYEKDIGDISTAQLVELMKQADGKGRLYEDLRTILNQIFNYAVCNNLIANNPVKLVEFRRSERKHGQALSVEEERTLIQHLEGSPYRQGFLAMLFFGLRPSEVATVKIDGNFIVAQNAKRKKGKVEYKRIPISPMARKYIDFSKPLAFPTINTSIPRAFKKILPNHIPYDLRHTFATRCQQFVRQEIVEIWLGDSPSRLIGNTYTHFPDNFMYAEMQKVEY